MTALEQIIPALDKALQSHPDGKMAGKFINHYLDVGHSVDDIIDGKKDSREDLLMTYSKLLDLYSSEFYHKYYRELYPVMAVVHDMYANSVALEYSADPQYWKTQYSAAYSHAGNMVIVFIIKMLCGDEVSRIVSMALTEHSYLTHHDKDGKRI